MCIYVNKCKKFKINEMKITFSGKFDLHKNQLSIDMKIMI